MEKYNRILIVDGLNNYMRAYAANPTMSTNGIHVGGIVGFLKILQKVLREVKPTRVVIAWDGDGGSKKRKLINKDYKFGRKPIRLNRTHNLCSEEQEKEGRLRQQLRLIEYFNYMPIKQIIADGIEADDLISWTCQSHACEDWQKVILSNDKDFFQILDECTILIRPSSDKPLTIRSVIDEYGIHPTNFALARAMSGDRSDNLKGVKGIGLKTVANKFPFLQESVSYTIDYTIQYCKDNYEGYKSLGRIIESRSLIKNNYDIMQLYSPSISFQTTQILKKELTSIKPCNNQTAIKKMLVQDGIFGVNFDELFASLNRIEHNERQLNKLLKVR